MPKMTNKSKLKDRFVYDMEWFAARVHNNKAIASFRKLQSCVVTAGGHSEHCLNTEWAVSSWYSQLKHINCWCKAVQSFICYSWIFNTQLHVHLIKWTLKFKLLHPLNHISCFNKTHRVHCMNTHVNNLKVWTRSSLRLLNTFFFLGDCFLLAHPVYQQQSVPDCHVQIHVTKRKFSAGPWIWRDELLNKVECARAVVVP